MIDGILKETSTKAIEENKIKVAGQPKINLKTFGEGKDLDYTIDVDILPEIKLKPLESLKVTDYQVSVESNEVEKRIESSWEIKPSEDTSSTKTGSSKEKIHSRLQELKEKHRL